MRRFFWLAGFALVLAACGSGNNSATVPFDSVITGPPPAPALPKLVFEPVAKTVRVNNAMPPIRVDVKDSNNQLMDVADTVILTIANNPTGANLGGRTLTVSTHGVATFQGVTFDTPGQGYTLRASAVNRIAGTSDSITVTP